MLKINNELLSFQWDENERVDNLPMLTRYRELNPGEFFVIGVDTAAGGSDYCAAQFLSKTKLDVPIVIILTHLLVR